MKNQSGTSLTGASLTLTGPGSYSATGSTGSGNTYTFPNVPINATGYTVTGTLGAGTGSTPGVVVSSTSPKAATVTINTGSIAVTVKDQSSAAVNGGNLTLTGPGSYSATGSPGSGNTYTFTLVPVGTSSYTVAAAVGAGSGSTSGVVVSATTPAKAAAVTVTTGTLTITVDGASPTCTKRGNVVVTLSGANGYSTTATTSNVTGSGKGIATFSGVPAGSPYTATDSSGDTTSSVISSPNEHHRDPLAEPQVLMRARGLQSTVRREHGFTLIEMLVTMFIVGIVFAAFGLVISTTVRHAALITNESVTQHQVRTALGQLTEDLREATVSSDSDTSPFVTTAGVMSSTSLTFYAPDSTYSTADQTDYHLREISYQLSGGNFQRASSASSNTGGPPWTLPALGSFVTLVPGVVSSAAFTYYDGNQPPAVTTDPAAVRTVVVTLTVAIPGTANQQVSYSDTATLRETPPT